MKTKCCITSLVVLGGLLGVVVWGADQQKPTLTKAILMQAVEKIRKGDRTVFSSLSQELARRADKIIVPPELLPEFVALLEEDKPELQLLGAQGLYILKSPQSKEALVKYLKTKDLHKTRRLAEEKKLDKDQYFTIMGASGYAIMTLGEIGDKSLVPFLESFRDVEGLRGEWGTGAAEKALAKLGAEGIESLSKLGPNADGNAIFAAQNAILRREPKAGGV